MTETIKMIKREMKQRHMSILELSQKLGLHKTSIHGMLGRNTIQVQKLADLCEVFQYNFFREIAEHLPYKEPFYNDALTQKEAELTEEINRLKEENKTLDITVDVLKEVIEKIGS